LVKSGRHAQSADPWLPRHDHSIVVQTIREDFPPIVAALQAALQQLR
jgi:hypothetical protein